MFCDTAFVAIYCIIGTILTAALLTDKHCCSNKKEAAFACVAGILWPLAVAVAASFGLFDNIKDKLRERRAQRFDRLRRFAAVMMKMKLIGQDTLVAVEKRMNEY